MEKAIVAKLSEHFDESEFACHCGRGVHCDAPPISPELVAFLEKLRSKLGKPVRITSGTRCAYWNKRVGGAPGSLHVRGLAADIAVGNEAAAKALDKLADELGAGGIGLAKTFVHVDLRPRALGFPPLRWSYGPKAVA